MGWETRKGGSYYYAKERIGSRVVSRYVGCGETALLIGQFEALRREEKAEEREALSAEMGAIKSEDDEADAIYDAVAQITKAALLAAGCHQHNGQWRRIRWPEKSK